jgi:hypothetical protein
MSGFSRRLAVFSAGVAAIALEVALPSSAKAWGKIETAEHRQQCADIGGTVYYSKEKEAYYCQTSQQDDHCTEISPKFNDKGERYIAWVYNFRTDECEYVDCFMTTACVGRVGLADDCFELATLRRFRDDVLAHMPGGAADIALYYRHAPDILRRLKTSGDAAHELARLYARYVLPSALAARLGLNRIARGIYTRMMRELADRYGVVLT